MSTTEPLKVVDTKNILPVVDIPVVDTNKIVVDMTTTKKEVGVVDNLKSLVVDSQNNQVVDTEPKKAIVDQKDMSTTENNNPVYNQPKKLL
jgi:hypothetical protein